MTTSKPTTSKSTTEKRLTVWTVARRPRWIGALLLALLIAAGFAALGQWQLERSVVQATVGERASEQPVPLESVAEPQQPVRSDSAGQLVTLRGTLVPGDTTVISGRANQGEVGHWVVGHVVTEQGPSVALALGWAETEGEADAAADRLQGRAASTAIVGRYLPSEAPQLTDFEEGERSTVSAAALINEWNTVPDGVYGGYVVAQEAAPGLAVIDSPPPDEEVRVNWLSLFYALEWAVFAGFAIYLWYRLVRDAWEREVHEQAPEAAQLN